MAHLLLVGSPLQLRELDLDEGLQVKSTNTSSRSLCCSSKGLLGAALDLHLLALLLQGLLDCLGLNLRQGGGFLRCSRSLLGAWNWSLQILLTFDRSLLCSLLDSRLGNRSLLCASFDSLLGSSRVLWSHVFLRLISLLVRGRL